MEENMIQLEQFEDRIIFMSMKNDIDWGQAIYKETYVDFFRSCRVRKTIH